MPWSQSREVWALRRKIPQAGLRSDVFDRYRGFGVLVQTVNGKPIRISRYRQTLPSDRQVRSADLFQARTLRVSDAARRIFSMSNLSPIRTASVAQFTLSTFTLRTDAVTYLSPGGDFRQICKRSIPMACPRAREVSPEPLFLIGSPMASSLMGGHTPAARCSPDPAAGSSFAPGRCSEKPCRPGHEGSGS